MRIEIDIIGILYAIGLNYSNASVRFEKHIGQSLNPSGAESVP